MRALLVRHGEAVDAGEASSEEERWLTRRGRDVTRELAARLAVAGLPLGRIVTSPLVRAVQTAEIIAAGLGDHFTGPVEPMRALATGSAATLCVRALLDGARDEALAIVGHEPSMHELAAGLLGARFFPPFRTSMACLLLRTPGGSWSFQWILDPRADGLVESIDGIDP